MLLLTFVAGTTVMAAFLTFYYYTTERGEAFKWVVGSQPDLTNIFATFIGAVVGVLITIMFYRLQEQQDRAQKQVLEMFANFMYPKFSTAFQLGQDMAQLHLSSEVSKAGSILKRIQEGTNTLSIDITNELSEYVKSRGWDLKAPSMEAVMKLEESLNRRLMYTQGNMVACHVVLGMSMQLLTSAEDRNVKRSHDISIELSAFKEGLDGCGFDPAVYDYCLKTIPSIKDGKVTGNKMVYFGLTIKYYVAHRGAQNKETKSLVDWLSSGISPSDTDFEKEAEKMTKPYVLRHDLNSGEITLQEFESEMKQLGYEVW